MKMMIAGLWVSLWFFAGANPAAADGESLSCLKKVAALDDKRDLVANAGGFWGLFEQKKSLAKQSSRAVQLDSKLNEILATLQYLCNTRNGVPFNELADYIGNNLAEIDEEEFKIQHLILGKSATEIDIWLSFYKISLRNRNRTLNRKQIVDSIMGADPIFDEYVMLAGKFSMQASAENLLQETIRLAQKIDRFLVTDEYMALAIKENSQVPFWDIDENYGGS